VCTFWKKGGWFGGQKLGILKETPLIKYKDALYDLKKHCEREYHKTATLRSLEFIKCFEGKQQTIEVQLDDQLKFSTAMEAFKETEGGYFQNIRVYDNYYLFLPYYL